MKTIIFDLDGTLVDPREGTLNTYRYVFEKLKMPCPNEATLLRFIGPPLKDNFASVWGPERPDLIKDAIRHFRQRYDKEGGLLNTRVYPGIKEALKELREQGTEIHVATSKATGAAVEILVQFGLRSYVGSVHGNNQASDRPKGAIVAGLMDAENLSPFETQMVGDRAHDVVAASQNGVKTAGALWGYGSKDELLSAGAVTLLAAPQDLPRGTLFMRPPVRAAQTTRDLSL